MPPLAAGRQSTTALNSAAVMYAARLVDRLVDRCCLGCTIGLRRGDFLMKGSACAS